MTEEQASERAARIRLEQESPWQARMAAIESELRAWRAARPRATLTKIGAALDQRLRAARAQLLAEVAGATADVVGCCPDGGAHVVRRGQRTRAVATDGYEVIALQRPYASCPAGGTGLFPLDELLALLPGTALSPRLIAGIVRLGTAVPFAQVPAIRAHSTGVTVSTETVRRWTEAAGAAQVARETAAVERSERELPAPPPGPAIQQVRVDGAMVPLVGGEWAEVKTLALGSVVDPGAGGPRADDLSSVSRLTDATTFGRLATVETQRRGTETAGTEVAVVDGAPWCREVIDRHRPDAVRILDFPRALEHLSGVAQAVFGAGTAAASEWLGQQAHALHHGDPTVVLQELARLAVAGAPEAIVTGCHAYLTKRRDQIQSAVLAAQGYPIGSGSVESGHTLVVAARLKGRGSLIRKC